MELAPEEAKERLLTELWPARTAGRDHFNNIDRWARWDHERPHSPRQNTNEYAELLNRAQTPWGTLVVTAVAQNLFVDGYRSGDDSENAGPWDWWQRNGMDARQIAIHRAALSYGIAYATVVPGTDPMSGEVLPVIRGRSPRSMIALYADPVDDEWPEVALLVTDREARVYDDQRIHRFTLPAKNENGDDQVEYLGSDEHGAGVCPVVKYCNQPDLEGRAPGEIEPLISTLARIDQTTGDRLIVQRFASWVVRTISGMAEPDTESDAARAAMKLSVSDILIAEDPDTKFGSLAATPLGGFIEAKDADIRDLAAVSQTPPHHLLGQMANLSAEALVAAESALTAKTDERKTVFGEAHEQTLRLAAHIAGDDQAAADFSAQVRWKDTQSRSLAQTADALGKLAQMLNVPPEFLWQYIPGWTQQDVDTAKAMAEQGGALESLMRELNDPQQDANGLDPAGV